MLGLPRHRPAARQSKSAADWLATVQRMSGKKPGHLERCEVADIAAYLALVTPGRSRSGKKKTGSGQPPAPRRRPGLLRGRSGTSYIFQFPSRPQRIASFVIFSSLWQA